MEYTREDSTKMLGGSAIKKLSIVKLGCLGANSGLTKIIIMPGEYFGVFFWSCYLQSKSN